MESIDRSEAEEALLIAARMQHEHRERLSLSELKSTAAEVDIAPEFVDQALEVMRRRETIVAEPSSPAMKRGDVFIVANLVVVQTVLAVAACSMKEFPVSPPVMFALSAAGIAGFQTAKNRRTNQILTYSVIFSIMVMAICESFARQTFERTEITVRSMSLLLVEVAIFLVLQYLKSRARAKAPTEQDFKRTIEILVEVSTRIRLVLMSVNAT